MQGLLLAGRYRLGESIGKGGMGRVWRAHDELLHRIVAVKELTAAQYAPDSERRVLLARTRAEARATARVNHPAVVTIHDVLEHDDRPWIVMELVQGSSLSDTVKEKGTLDPRYAAHVGLWVLRALHAAHQAGVLHRDVKPGNVMLADDGRVLLADFGIAQVQGDATITRTGEIVGSADYLAPERVRGHDPGPASDLWALGCTLYAAVSGRSPFRRATPLGTMQAVVDEDPAVPRGGGPLTSVIMSLLRKDPDARPAAEALETLLSGVAEGRAPEVADHPPTAVHSTTAVTHRYEGTRDAVPSRGTGQPQDAVPAGYAQNAGALSVGSPPAGAGITPSSHTGVHRVAGPRRRHGARTALIVAAAVVLVATGTLVGVHYAQRDLEPAHPEAPPESSSPDPTGSPGGQQNGTLPKGWHREADPKGFSVAVPNGWKRQPSSTGTDYTPDDGVHLLRISIDDQPDFDSPYRHAQNISDQLRDKPLPAYAVRKLTSNIFRDRKGALLEFTWNAAPGDPRHAIDQVYYNRDDVENAIYLSGPQAEWPALRKKFNLILRSWRP